ncbi:unnamed protein product [Blepharisma stoltei]|uniref:Uncharacterized protein n=1 Tax=Blepharisma stoltei TaxID=1481888 RepID=A0AAU9J5V6_9CILI|nr:unnamed protein product [Blepharisma stoltei]
MGGCNERETVFEEESVRDLRTQMVIEYLKQRKLMVKNLKTRKRAEDTESADENSTYSEDENKSAEIAPIEKQETKRPKIEEQDEAIEEELIQKVEFAPTKMKQEAETEEVFIGAIEISPMRPSLEIQNIPYVASFRPTKKPPVIEKIIQDAPPRPSLGIQKIPLVHSIKPKKAEELKIENFSIQTSVSRPSLGLEIMPISVFEPIRATIHSPIKIEEIAKEINQLEERDFSPLPNDKKPKFKKLKEICVDDLFVFQEDINEPLQPDIKFPEEEEDMIMIKTPAIKVEAPAKQEAGVESSEEQVIDFQFSPEIPSRDSEEISMRDSYSGANVFVKSRKRIHMFRDNPKPLTPEMHKLNLECRLTIDEEARKSIEKMNK